MPDIFGILNVGRGALLAQQKAIDVTGHNIANVNTLGYSRQRINMETNVPISFWPGQMGTGVRAAEVQRIYDRFLGTQINNENQNMGKWEAQKGALEKVEMIFDEASGFGLNLAMSDFWNAWQDLSDNPSGQAERTVVLAKGERLADTFQGIYSNLEKTQEDMDASIAGTVQDINLIAEQIAHLNRQISEVEINVQNANDYRDKRDLLLTELSGMIDFNSFEDGGGNVAVLVGNGRPLVEGNNSWELSTEPNADGFQDIVWIDSDGNSTNITDDISGGRLKGWIHVRDDVITASLASLDGLAGNIINEINNLHSLGFGLGGSTGYDFFSGTLASDISVNTDIIDDINLIAAAENPGGEPGDNGNAIAMANLQNDLIMNAGTATFDGYYNSFVSSVGSEVQEAAIGFNHQTTMVTHLNNSREAVSGVSLDEEMVNLLEFQHAYDAAAKLISTVDELLETIINM